MREESNPEVNMDLLKFEDKPEENKEKLEKTLEAWAHKLLCNQVRDFDFLNKYREDFLKLSEYLDFISEKFKEKSDVPFFIVEICKYKKEYINIIIRIIFSLLGGEKKIQLNYKIEECRQILHSLPIKDWRYVFEFIADSAEKEQNFSWKKHIEPFWKEIVPKSNRYLIGLKKEIPFYTGRSLLDNLLIITVYSGDGFSEALELIGDWLADSTDIFNILHKIDELSQKFPQEILYLLYVIIGDGKNLRNSYTEIIISTIFNSIKKNLHNIKEKIPELEKDYRYKELQRLCGAKA